MTRKHPHAEPGPSFHRRALTHSNTSSGPRTHFVHSPALTILELTVTRHALNERPSQLFRSEAFKALLQNILGDATSVVASRRQARRFRPGLDYTLATPGAPWEWKKSDGSAAKGLGSGGDGNAEGVSGTHRNDVTKDESGGGEEHGEPREQYMVLDAVLCFVDDREPYKEAAWRQDEVGGYVTYLGGDDDDDEPVGSDNADYGVPPPQDGGGGGGSSDASGGAAKPSSDADRAEGSDAVGGAGAQKNDAAVYKADEGGSLVSVSAASNALSLVLRDDAGISSFVKYVSSAAPGSRFDVVGEYLVVCSEDVDDDDDESADAEEDSSSSDGSYGVPGAGLLETVPEGEEEEEEEEGDDGGRSRKKMKPSSNGV